MAAFRSAARDLEQQLAGILASAAAQAACLPARLDVIEAFGQAATRDGLRCGPGPGGMVGMAGVHKTSAMPAKHQILHTSPTAVLQEPASPIVPPPPPPPPPRSKAVETQLSLWHQAFLGELAAAKRAFEGLKAELPAGAALPPCSGRMLVVRGLLCSIERSWDHLQALAGGGCLPAVPKASEAAAAYEALHMGMQQYANALHVDVRGWGWWRGWGWGGGHGECAPPSKHPRR